MMKNGLLVSVRNVHHRLRHLNTWLTVELSGGGLGGAGLLGEPHL